MTRMSKQGERRNRYPHRPRPPMPKTGSKKDNLPEGYRPHENALEGESAQTLFIGKVK